MPPQVIFDLTPPHRWIERNRNATGELYTEEGGKIVELGGQHDADGPTRFEPLIDQPGGHRPRPPLEITIGELLDRAVAGVVGDVAALRMSLDMPIEHGEEAGGTVRSLVGTTHGFDSAFARQHRSLPLRARPFQGSQQISRSLGAGQELIGEAEAKGPLEANEKLRPAQTVEAEVLFQRGIQGEPTVPMLSPWVELLHQLPHELEESLRTDCWWCLGRDHLPRPSWVPHRSVPNTVR